MKNTIVRVKEYDALVISMYNEYHCRPINYSETLHLDVFFTILVIFTMQNENDISPKSFLLSHSLKIYLEMLCMLDIYVNIKQYVCLRIYITE